MKIIIKTLGILILILLAAVILLPQVIPVPPLEGLLPAQERADPDSLFIEVNDLSVHYKAQGSGEPVLVLLHGFGASSFSWQQVQSRLAQQRSVVAFDRPAFGLTERPQEWDGPSPYGTENQVALTTGLMDALGFEQAVLVGNSAGGTVAALTALEHPERVRALILVDAAIYTGGGTPAFLQPLFQTGWFDRVGLLLARQIQVRGRAFAESAWHDPSQLTPEMWAGYTRPLQAENWDRALWELTKASRPQNIPERLGELTLPVLVITGDDDRIVPTADSIRLANALPNARLVVIPNCGHVPQEECPQEFISAVEEFLSGLD